MKFEYDKPADVLYVTLEERDAKQCRYRENVNGDVVWLDSNSGEVVGVTIISFLLRINKGLEISVPEIGSARLKKHAERLNRERKRA